MRGSFELQLVGRILLKLSQDARQLGAHLLNLLGRWPAMLAGCQLRANLRRLMARESGGLELIFVLMPHLPRS